MALAIVNELILVSHSRHVIQLSQICQILSLKIAVAMCAEYIVIILENILQLEFIVQLIELLGRK